MYAKVMSISDELMWRYYLLLTDLTPAEIEEEKAKGAPMAAKMALGRRLVGEFHGERPRPEAEAEWRRVHQEKQAPAEMADGSLAPGRYKARELLTRPGTGRIEERGGALAPPARRTQATAWCSSRGPRSRRPPGESFVLSIGAQRFVRFSVAPG